MRAQIKTNKNLIFQITVLTFFLFNSTILSQSKNYLSVSAGSFDFNKQINTSSFGRIEYRSAKKLLFLHPITGAMVNTDGGFFIFAGITMDIHLNDFLVLTPSFAPGYYNKGKGKDLFYALEFRSKIELAFKFISGIRFGLSFSHISNASLGPPNPGVENYALNLSIPF